MCSQSISMCFILSWKTGFAVTWIVVWLSQCTSVGLMHGTCRVSNKLGSYSISLMAYAITRYSASLEDWEIMACFFIFRDTGALPSFIR